MRLVVLSCIDGADVTLIVIVTVTGLPERAAPVSASVILIVNVAE